MSSPVIPWLRRSRRPIRRDAALIVDAGMHELWYSGCMPPRVRMIAASRLIEDLLPSRRANAARLRDMSAGFAGIKPGAAACGAA